MEILKNKSIQINGDSWGRLSITIYHKDKKGVLSYDKNYKFDGFLLEGVDLEVSVPKGCRTKYAKIIKIK